MKRRDYLRITGGGIALLAGCVGEDESEIKDSDGDGVIDSEDYAPQDPDVQEKSDLENVDKLTPTSSSNSKPTTKTPTTTELTTTIETTTTTSNSGANVIQVNEEYWENQSRLLSYSSQEVSIKVEPDHPETDFEGAKVYVSVDEFPRSDNVFETLSGEIDRETGEKIKFDIDISNVDTVDPNSSEQDPKYNITAGLVPANQTVDDIDYSELRSFMETDPFVLRPDETTIDVVGYSNELEDDSGDNYTRNNVEGAYATEISNRTNGKRWSVSYYIYKSAHAEAVNRSRGRSREQYVNYELTNGAAPLLARLLKSDAESLEFTGHDEVKFVIDFVQSLPYVPDDVSKGYDDYTKFITETLPEMGGDCEDTAIMLAAILEAEEFNYDMILIQPPGHMAAGIWQEDPIGYHWELDGREYAYIETTGQGWETGDCPEEYQNTEAYLHQV